MVTRLLIGYLMCQAGPAWAGKMCLCMELESVGRSGAV